MRHHRLGKRSKSNLATCHVDLIILTHEALKRSPWDFGIHSGLRELEEQRELYQAGKSRVIHSSKHLGRKPVGLFFKRIRVSHALDYHIILPNGEVTWDIEYYQELGSTVWLPTAEELGIDIELGAFWESIQDGPHVEMKIKV